MEKSLDHVKVQISDMASITYFDQAAKLYNNVPVSPEGGIETNSFLEATESLCGLFDLLGSTAFSPVKSDILGNVVKIRSKFLENPVAYNTMQSILEAEKNAGSKKRVASEGMLWLKRGLEFTSLALRRNVDDPNEELKTSFQKAYEVTLSKYHSFLVRPVFSLAMNACPYRKDFYLKLGSDGDKVQQQLSVWLVALEQQVKLIDDAFKIGGYDKIPF